MSEPSADGAEPADAGPADTGLGPRERMVRAAARLIRSQGVSGTGMRAVVAAADAPRGSLQHYFPGGKDQLVSEALLGMGDLAGRAVARVLERLVSPTPADLFAGIVDRWRQEFLTRGFDAGCPLVAAAADTAASSDRLRAVVAEAFAAWEEPLAAALVVTGVEARRAPALATVLIAALEGAIVLARVRRQVAPLDAVVGELTPLLDAAVG